MNFASPRKILCRPSLYRYTKDQAEWRGDCGPIVVELLWATSSPRLLRGSPLRSAPQSPLQSTWAFVYLYSEGLHRILCGLAKFTFLFTNAGFRLTCRLPHCRYAAWSSLAVSELQLSAATPLWLYHRAASLPSCIEFNCLRSAAVGKAARLSIYWLDAACRCLPLGHPSAASGACAVEQISSSKRQCGKRQVSLKPALRVTMITNHCTCQYYGMI